MTRWTKGDIAAVLAALAAGLAIGWVDSRPTWDDTGITVGAVVLSAGLLALLRPRPWWAIALAVGVPLPVLAVLSRGGLASVVAIAFALVAAAIGMAAGKVARSLAGP